MRLQRQIFILLAVTMLLGPSMIGCSNGKTEGMTAAEAHQYELETLTKEAEVVIARIKKVDPSMNKFFDESAGYAVFPTIAKGGFGIGGLMGDGVVYVDGKVIGTTNVKAGSIGFQLGGQTFSELIFFEDEDALEHFKKGNAEFDATASAVAASAGAAAKAKYANGTAIFITGEKGLMAEASIGGQGFSFKPAQH